MKSPIFPSEENPKGRLPEFSPPFLEPSPEDPLISRLQGVLLSQELSTVEVQTQGGVVYEVEVPLTVQERLPAVGSPLELRTVQVTREDSVSLYGFLEPHERELFRRLLSTSGIGARLALAMLSTYSASRLARALAEKDIPALTQISGVGRKTAERIALELSEKVQDMASLSEGALAPTPVQGAVSALVALGYTFSEADAAVRGVLTGGAEIPTEELIRKALAGR